MTGAQRALLQALLLAHGGILEWPKKPFRDATLHALQDKGWVKWRAFDADAFDADAGKLRESIKITEEGLQAFFCIAIVRSELCPSAH